MPEGGYTDAQLAAYRALAKAAERMGYNGYLAASKGRARPRNWRPVGIYAPTEAHREVLEAMPKVLSGEMTPNDAMALLWQGDVMDQRLGAGAYHVAP